MTTAWRGVALSALLACFVASGARAQLGPVEVVTATSAIDSTNSKGASATCPPGKIAFSGGVSRIGGLATTPLVSKYSVPFGDLPPAIWAGLITEMTPSADSWGIQVWALCATVGGYELIEAASAFDSNDKTLTVDCPPGKVPIGGGGRLLDQVSDLRLDRLVPTATGWQVRARESSPVASNWQILAYVSCASGIDVEQYQAYTPSQGEGSDDLDLVCPAGWIALGGGVQLAGAAAAIDRSAALHVGGTPFGWSVGGRRLAGGSAWDLAGVVLCLDPASP